MIHLSIDDIKPGMVLARPVRNPQGVLLLKAGARITKKNIRIFKSWGVGDAAIEGQQTGAENHTGDRELRVKESVEKRLKEKFSDVMDDPVMAAIFNAASKLLMRDFPNNGSDNEHL